MTDVSALTGAADQAVNAAQARLTTDTQSFLKLLTTQLANQDPLAPVDPTQFVSQLAQFSSVEQAVQSNSRLAEVLSQLRVSGERMDLGYIGREVDVATNVITLTEDGAKARYSTPEDAARVEVAVLDEKGNVVRRFPGDTVAGAKDFAWDGKTDDGAAAAPGSYTLDVKAFDAEGEELETAVAVSDKVKRVTWQDGQTLFLLESGAAVGRDQILSAG